MNRTLTFSLSIALASAAFAGPPVAILSSVPLASNNVVPGFSGATWTTTATTIALDRIRVSPNGENWVAIGRIEAGATDEDVLVVGTGWSISNITTHARENTITPWGLLYDDISNISGVAINDSGTVLFGGDDTNSSTNLDGFLATLESGSVTRVRSEGDIALGLPSGNFMFGGLNSCNIDAASNIYFNVTTGANAGVGRRTQYRNGDIRYRAQDTPVTNLGGLTTTFSSITDNGFWVSADGTKSVFIANFTIPSAGTALIVDGVPVIQRATTIPGNGFTTPVSVINASNHASSNGNYINYGSNEAVSGSAVDWVFSNGQVIAKRGDAITPGNAILWDDTAFSNGFFSVAINNLGESVIGGLTTEPDTTRDAKLVCNGKVILTEGDEVDMDGDGDGDGLFISIFNNSNNHLDDNLIYTFTAVLKDAGGVQVGNALMRFAIPIPGDINGDNEVGPADFSLLAAAFGSFVGDPNYNAAADINGDEEVGPADFAILSANFGRLR